MQQGKVLGVIFDLTLEHQKDGRRIIDCIKDVLINFLKTNFCDEDLFYLYNPLVTETLMHIGEQVGTIKNYETDGWRFDLEYALKQTLYVIGAEDEDYQKCLVVISNRSVNPFLMQKIQKINQKDDYGCKIFHISLKKDCVLDLESSIFSDDCNMVNDLLVEMFNDE